MNEQIELRLQSQDDDASARTLMEFLEPVGVIQVQREDDSFRKSFGDPVDIVIKIVETWATKRYVLDPLADQAGLWWKSVRALSDKSATQRKFNITVKFAGDNHEIILSGTSEQERLKEAWAEIKKAKEVREHAVSHGLSFDRISIRYDGSDEPLVVGFIGDKLTHSINLK